MFVFVGHGDGMNECVCVLEGGVRETEGGCVGRGTCAVSINVLYHQSHCVCDTVYFYSVFP